MAVERMLAHRSGMMGFPLRLLAREVYDRVVALRGPEQIALITGEERCVPDNPRYFICTVEAMPLDRRVAFLAVDEIQLAADRERGHVFTDRLLHARGTEETMFMGSAIIRPLIRQLVPEAVFISRPRLSSLSHAGHRKITRLEPRSAVIAFSAEAVYRLAEEMRTLRGGCAVVLGALSPRTRNAQVAMYQAGEIDYMVATDAIGMGLNMDLDHVAFSADRKFDGRGPRRLTTAEIAQIAGRAGRHTRDGTFGTTGKLEPFEPDLVAAIEEHRFRPLREVHWRNADLCFASIGALLESLDEPADIPGLRRVHGADDHLTLAALARDQDVSAMARDAESVALLWQACQIPDFRKTLAEAHIRLVRQVFLHLAESGRLPDDWVAGPINRLDRIEGDIDTLTARISHVRTWTYISHRAGWMEDRQHWQEQTRAIEDRLSDALHERLTQRFVDKRARVLVRRDGAPLFAHVADDGAVSVEQHGVGRLVGFRFCPEADAQDNRLLSAAANRALERERARRVALLSQDDDDAFTLGLDPNADAAPRWGELAWRGALVARLTRGDDALHPAIDLAHCDELNGSQRERVRRRLAQWLETALGRRAAPLRKLQETPLRGTARGIAFALSEALGCLGRDAIAGDLKTLDAAARSALSDSGVRLGALTLYLPAMLKPARARIAALLWCVWTNRGEAPPLPPDAAVSMPRVNGTPSAYYAALGFVVLGRRAIRADIAERFAARVRKSARKQPFSVDRSLHTLIGCRRDDVFDGVLEALGYQVAGIGTDGEKRYAAKPRSKKRPAAKPERRVDPHSPFSKLRALSLDEARVS